MRNVSPKVKERLYKEETPQEEFYKIFKRYTTDDVARFFSSSYFNGDLIHKFGGFKQLENLERNDEISSAIEKRRAALINAKVVIEHENPKVVKFFEEQILPWEHELKLGFFNAVEWGYGVTQIIYNKSQNCKVDGYQVEDPWDFIPHEDLIHASLWNEPSEVLPYGKWIVSHYGAKASRPQGLGLYERLIIPYMLKCGVSELWDFYLKRFAGGFITAQAEFKQDLEDLRKALDHAEAMGSIVTTQNANIASLGFQGDPTAFQNRDQVLAKSIQKVVLGETQTTDQGSVGSSLSARVHNDVRWEKTLFDMQVLKSSFQMLVEQIAFTCKARKSQIPKINVVLEQGVDTERLDSDVKLFGMGVRFKKKYFENKYNLESDEFEVADPATLAGQQSPLGGLFGGLVKPSTLDQERKRLKASGKHYNFINDPDEIAELGQDRINLPISPDDLESAVLSAKDKKDLQSKLLALYDNTNLEFVEDFAEILYASAASGALRGIPPNKKIEPLDEKDQKDFIRGAK